MTSTCFRRTSHDESNNNNKRYNNKNRRRRRRRGVDCRTGSSSSSSLYYSTFAGRERERDEGERKRAISCSSLLFFFSFFNFFQHATYARIHRKRLTSHHTSAQIPKPASRDQGEKQKEKKRNGRHIDASRSPFLIEMRACCTAHAFAKSTAHRERARLPNEETPVRLIKYDFRRRKSIAPCRSGLPAADRARAHGLSP